MSQLQTLFTCESCGKQYRWKPELAGRKVKCKCGAVLAVPEAAPAEDDGLYDLADDVAPPPARAAAEPGKAVSAAAAHAPVGPPLETSQAAGYQCPSCHQPIEPGVFLCAHCGFNLRTGEKTAPRRVTAAGAAPAAATGQYYRPGPVRMADAGASGAVKPLIGLGVVLLLIGAVVGFRFILQGEEVPQLGDDAQVLKLIKDDGATELIEWLEGSSRRLVMGMTRYQAEEQAKRFYEMGAKKVLAFGGVMTKSLAIELPDDPQQRKALFDWEHQWHTEMFVEPATDVGQKYLLLRMRL